MIYYRLKVKHFQGCWSGSCGCGEAAVGRQQRSGGRSRQVRLIYVKTPNPKCRLFVCLDVQDRYEQKKKPSSLKREKIWHFKTEIFFTFVSHFGTHGSGSVFPMRILIQPTKMNADLCGSGSATLPLDTGMFGAHFTFSLTFF